MKALSVCLGVAAASVMAGCDYQPAALSVKEDSKHSSAPDLQVAIPPRTNTWFTNAILWKPEPQTLLDTNATFSLLAPLLMQEVSEGHSNRAGIFSTGDDREIKASSDAVLIGGQHHARIAYRFSVPQTNDLVHEVEIRITLNSDGLPAIWETIDYSKGLKQVYVSRALEEKAAKQFGKPTPPNRFSIESEAQAEKEAPVIRVLEDAPVPMGPILYINASGVIETVICRCMPGQASSVVSTLHYKLIDQTSLGVSEASGDPPRFRYPSTW